MTLLTYIKFLFISVLICINTEVILSQTVINGAQVFSGPNSIIKISNDSLILNNGAHFQQQGLLSIDKDFYVNDGSKTIDGTVEIFENLINNDTIIGLSNNSEIRLKGNWTNNHVFIAGQNKTILNGNTQIINGSEITTFYNLEGLGNLSDKKELQSTDAFVSNTLSLNDVEITTNQNNLVILNPQANAINRIDGFVSSEGVGRLERNTNTTQEYLFPTGSTNGTTRYRPVIVKPNQSNSQTFAVRLANNDANLDNLDRTETENTICDINPFFYHKIYGSTNADISIHTDPIEDGNWNSTAHWQNALWNKTSNETISTNASLTAIETKNWNDYNTENFALAI